MSNSKQLFGVSTVKEVFEIVDSKQTVLFGIAAGGKYYGKNAPTAVGVPEEKTGGRDE